MIHWDPMLEIAGGIVLAVVGLYVLLGALYAGSTLIGKACDAAHRRELRDWAAAHPNQPPYVPRSEPQIQRPLDRPSGVQTSIVIYSKCAPPELG